MLPSSGRFCRSQGRAARAKKSWMPYRLSALAERDLEEIWSNVAEDASPATADRLMDAVIDRFEMLAGVNPIPPTNNR
jgi:hypothetical protein